MPSPEIGQCAVRIGFVPIFAPATAVFQTLNRLEKPKVDIHRLKGLCVRPTGDVMDKRPHRSVLRDRVYGHPKDFCNLINIQFLYIVELHDQSFAL